MKAFSILTIVVLSSNILAQNVEVITKGNFTPTEKGKSKIFNFMLPDTDTTDLIHVATFKAITDDKKSKIAYCYFEIEKQARKLGANCFRLAHFKDEAPNSFTLILETYFAKEVNLQRNIEKLPTNKVFVFCNEVANNEIYSLKVNGVKKNLNQEPI